MNTIIFPNLLGTTDVFLKPFQKGLGLFPDTWFALVVEQLWAFVEHPHQTPLEFRICKALLRSKLGFTTAKNNYRNCTVVFVSDKEAFTKVKIEV